MRPQSVSSVNLRVAPCAPCREPARAQRGIVAFLSLLALLGVVACKGEAPAITGKEWRVVAIGDHLAPVGSGGRMLTMTFDYESSRVSGFSGCNQYSAPYVLTGDTMVFGAATSTKMFCLDADSVERAFLQAIPAIATWQVDDTLLTLVGGGVAVKLREGQH